MNQYTPALIEGLKEMGRVVVLSIIPVAIEQLTGTGLNIKTLFIIGGVAVLRFLDKVLHESGKIDENKTLLGGITRF